MADFKPDFLGYNFIWFMGEVEDRRDPLKMGRVKVRCFGWHPKSKDELPTEALPWAQTIQPVTAPAAPSSGLTIGTWVFGFFMYGEDAQKPMVMGQIPGYRFDKDKQKGESELPRAARAEEDYPSPQSVLRKESRITDIGLNPHDGSTWDEPEEPDDKKYPYIQTVASEAGFITETIFGPFDEEDGRFDARQVTYDLVGGYDERKAPSGDKIVKVVGDNYEIVCGSSFVNVKGDINLTVEGNMTQSVTGDYTLNVGGNHYVAVGGTMDEFVLGKGVFGYSLGRDTYIVAGGDTRTIAAGGITDTIIAGGIACTVVAGGMTSTINGATNLTVTGAYNVQATTGTLTFGGGAVNMGSGSVTATVINSTTGNITTGNFSQIYVSVLKTGVASTVNIMTHKHIASGTPTTTPIP